MYYLNSRYYNPEIGRFINADGLIGETGDILGHNMYAYTQNNPVMYYDPSGEIGLLIGSIIVVGSLLLLNSDTTVPYDRNMEQKINDGTYKENMDDVVKDWGKEYSTITASDHKERGAYILSTKYKGKTYYYMGHTYTGSEGNVINGALLGYVLRIDKAVGFVHSHTAYLRSDGTWDPVDYGQSNADLFLLKIPGVKHGFIVDEKGNVYEYFNGDISNNRILVGGK